ncbi:hypothetical protein HIM_10062 [Hirsutella minnesotensis 3608]|uniref:Lipocalin/cytosolic fatty-acid binding domain-containing protein n=1 Tax=Hirsutella minnesotensis 3608 TaxID=1043627 RepID=A0A0F8A2N5_9HYPO|nr:hypothetical protein HIM_10062 [Hirsutella minnesotensis 3608]
MATQPSKTLTSVSQTPSIFQYRSKTVLKPASTFCIHAPAVLSAPSDVAASKGKPLAFVPVICDGKWFYPVPDGAFETESFVGRWFRVAGTKSSFTTSGCKRTIAEYAPNSDGSISVNNSCELDGKIRAVQGTAAAVDAKYGAAGAFRVSFPGRPEGPNTRKCSDPTYVVQDYTGGIAVISRRNFTHVGILSRNQNLDDKVIDI